MYATLSIDWKTNELLCVCHGTPAEATIHYQLVRHTSAVGSVTVTQDSSYRWDIKLLAPGGGNVHVQVTVETGGMTTVLETEWQYVPSDRIRTAYQQWLMEESPEVDPLAVSLRPANRPYETIAIVQFRGDWLSSSASINLAGICADTKSKIFPFEGQRYGHTSSGAIDPRTLTPRGTYILTSAQPSEAGADGITFGSGFAFDDGRIRRGSDVVKSLDRVAQNEVSEANDGPVYSSRRGGNFLAAVAREDNKIEFHTDYFGAAPWYEYESPRLRVVASSYLLAILVAHECGEELSLNTSVIDADFTSLTQGFQQPLMDELPLNGFTCLRPDKVVLVDASGERSEHRSIMGADLLRPERFTHERYEALIDEAVSELISNCEGILNDPRIREVRCDISGGLDSRLVLAAFLAGTGDRSKLTLYTSAKSPTDGDEKIALMISEATGINFSESPTVAIGPCSARHRASLHVAAELGTYWHSGHSASQKWDPETAYVSGSAMDNLARDYSTPTWSISATATSDPSAVSVNLARQLFRWRGRATIKPAPAGGVSEVARAWGQFPGDELDKGSQVFNFYRARFHGGGGIPAANGVWRVAPGPSRAFHQLRLMAGRVVAGPGMQIKMIHRMDERLSAIRYAKKVNNDAHEMLFGPVLADLPGDRSQLIRSRRVKQANSTVSPCLVCSPDSGIAVGSEDSLVDLVFSALRDLARDPELTDLMLPPFRFAHLYFPSVYNEKHSYGKTFANKVLHLHLMWRLARRVPSSS